MTYKYLLLTNTYTWQLACLCLYLYLYFQKALIYLTNNLILKENVFTHFIFYLEKHQSTPIDQENVMKTAITCLN